MNQCPRFLYSEYVRHWPSQLNSRFCLNAIYFFRNVLIRRHVHKELSAHVFLYNIERKKKKLYHCHFWIAREINLNDFACADRNACGYFFFVLLFFLITHSIKIYANWILFLFFKIMSLISHCFRCLVVSRFYIIFVSNNRANCSFFVNRDSVFDF